MTTKQFASFLSQLEATPLRNEITKILANLFKKTSDEEIDKVCYLILGQLGSGFEKIEFNIAEKTMVKTIGLSFGFDYKKVHQNFKKTGDLGETAVFFRKKTARKLKPSSLSVKSLHQKLLKIAQDAGLESQKRKVKAMAALLVEVDQLFLRFLVRIPLGRLRLGFSEITILDALSWMKTGDKSLRPKIEAVYNTSVDIGKIAKIFKKEGMAGLKKIKARPGIPIRPARAERLGTVEKIIEKLETAAIEPKIDGFRVQVHISRKPAAVRIFSRNLEDTTKMFPDLVAAFQKLMAKKKDLTSAIFDGEAIGFNPKNNRFLPFQETAQRKRKHRIAQAAQKTPLAVFIFDLLFYNGESLLNKTFKERRKKLSEVVSEKKGILRLTPQIITNQPQQIKAEFKKAISLGLEGIMCKKLNSSYQAGARNFNWVKYKKGMGDKLLDTIDCLVMGYYRGRGRRAGFGIGAFLAGVYQKKNDCFETIAKIGTGLTDRQWRELKKKCDRVKVSQKPKEYRVDKNLGCDIWCSPSIVVEIKADEITKSPIHSAGKDSSSGLALRFPRLVRFRDKMPKDSTTVEEVITLFGNQ